MSTGPGLAALHPEYLPTPAEFVEWGQLNELKSFLRRLRRDNTQALIFARGSEGVSTAIQAAAASVTTPRPETVADAWHVSMSARRGVTSPRAALSELLNLMLGKRKTTPKSPLDSLMLEINAQARNPDFSYGRTPTCGAVFITISHAHEWPPESFDEVNALEGVGVPYLPMTFILDLGPMEVRGDGEIDWPELINSMWLQLPEASPEAREQALMKRAEAAGLELPARLRDDCATKPLSELFHWWRSMAYS